MNRLRVSPRLRRRGHREIAMNVCKLTAEGCELRRSNARLREQVVQLTIASELTHFHRVFDRLPRAIHACRAVHQDYRTNVPVELWREPPVEAQLLLTKEGTPLE